MSFMAKPDEKLPLNIGSTSHMGISAHNTQEIEDL